ncbi:unnamed protein product [Scytosiphon promiscuus]
MSISELPLEHWELATNWRDGGSPISSNGISPKGSAGPGEGDGEATVSLGLLRTCFSERYGSHIPRMIHDLLLDIGQALTASGDEARAAALLDQEKGEKPGRGADSASTTTSPVTFHVTEYDVIRGQYPRSWEDHAGYIIPGGVASAVGKEPWMTTLLDEVKGLRKTGRCGDRGERTMSIQTGLWVKNEDPLTLTTNHAEYADVYFCRPTRPSTTTPIEIDGRGTPRLL